MTDAQTPIDFIKNILLDIYTTKTSMKEDALRIYTMLIQNNQEPAILTFPFSGTTLSISAQHYKEARDFYRDGQKIMAIKTIRVNGWVGTDKGSGPDLKSAKEFVESFPSLGDET